MATAAAPSALQSLVYTPAARGGDGNGSSSSSSSGGNGSGSVPTLSVLDQLLIPREKAYIEVKTVQDAWQVGRCACLFCVWMYGSSDRFESVWVDRVD